MYASYINTICSHVEITIFACCNVVESITLNYFILLYVHKEELYF